MTQRRDKKPEDLEKELTKLHQELSALQVGRKGTDQVNNLRKSIAHVYTVQNQTIKENLREFYCGEKYQPKDLRPKQTRAKRRAFTPKEQSISLQKTQRKKSTFPPRTFAIRDSPI